ncbi:MAG: hypothetical protein VX770_03060 [Candidatus Neomarinimicrobiota bacterium]|nr:hypothetical protein [Candidatus Neomarinimicrobiota bacterium]|tara:strand:- start:632 stop:1030 length:399 start_codon:yes stop_codon:yes gene_type:complete
MLDFLSFIIKLIFGGLLGAVCNYNKNKTNEIKDLFIGSFIGIIGTISTYFSMVFDSESLSFLIGSMIITSLYITKTFLEQNKIKMGINELIALFVGWFVGIGYILHGIILTLVLIFFLFNFMSKRSEDLDNT